MRNEADKFDWQFYNINYPKYDDDEDQKELESELKSDFNVEVKEAETALLIYVRNKSDKDVNLSLQVIVPDTNKNLRAPISRIEEA